MKNKVLIANRGEIALRGINACKELGLDYVAIYTQQDSESLHARTALEEDMPGRKRAWRVSKYDDPNEILEAADATGCNAIFFGYGMLSENWRVIRRLQKRSRPIIPIAPTWEYVRDLGSKVNTKKVARRLGIPTIPGSTSPVRDIIEAEEIVKRLVRKHGPDILIKASAGGGGRGLYELRNVDERSLDELALRFNEARSYARNHFHDDTLLIEHLFSDFNHIEVQIIGDRKGRIVNFGTRNCTIQSPQRQKRIELAPAFDTRIDYGFDPKKVMKEAIRHSMKMAYKLGYNSAGTWEWLVTKKGELYLLEVNTRIQVENDVSGRISSVKGRIGTNLIVEMIRTALGEELGYKQKHVSTGGRASIEFRILAEDVDKDFEQWAGTITRFDFPKHEWAAVYTHVPNDRPYKIITDYDPTLALVVIWGDSIDQAKERGKRFLDEVVIEGEGSKPLVTNLDYLKSRIPNLWEF
ncbi:acetyl-CoA carboxylase biotin carboxylase subunit [Candidatus Woesearchaeota archaeon]|nr:MAG: acetyl-CoA carboxylase biotin carboxylase subunit [Candidatus Woesearchaeota archaeon]